MSVLSHARPALLSEGEDAGVMCEDNMIQFFTDIGIEPEGMLTLAFAWRIGASTPGEFGREVSC